MPTKKSKTVLAFGTYDLFHPGHQYFLRECKKQGDRLVVIIARDVNVQRWKGHPPVQDEATRRDQVAAFEAVDEARLGYEDPAKRLQVIDDTKPDVICLGYDQKAKLPDGPWQVVRIPAFEPDQYKTTLLRQQSQ
jgi:cytidyltransferase-like protein